MCFSECPQSTGVWMLEWKCHLALGVSFHQQYQVCRPSPSAAHPPLGEWFGLVLAPDQGQLGAIPSPPPPASWCCAAQIPSVSPNLPFCSKRLSHRFAFESSREAVQQEREKYWDYPSCCCPCNGLSSRVDENWAPATSSSAFGSKFPHLQRGTKLILLPPVLLRVLYGASENYSFAIWKQKCLAGKKDSIKKAMEAVTSVLSEHHLSPKFALKQRKSHPVLLQYISKLLSSGTWSRKKHISIRQWHHKTPAQ